ncbi:hypothetical protein, partial [Tritonibacter sp. SIMBA_163]|uniref:hypothetical protein n=1 Tax=Tritonibacter sp. SIMBA_163 TaxID=3080868 RepID=UPI0039808210
CNADPRCVDGSKYIEVIQLYRRLAPDNPLMPVLLDDLRDDPSGTLAAVCEHIGVDAGVELLDDGNDHGVPASRSSQRFDQ